MWTKVSICLFLMRIPASKALIRPLQIAVVVLVVSNIVLTVLWVVQCRPISAVWDFNIHGHCFSRGELERIIISQAGMNMASTETNYLVMLKANSDISGFRFRICRLSHPDSMEGSDEIQNKGSNMLSHGSRRDVSYHQPPLFPNSRSLKYPFSTGACCIVRTVLNYQSLPEDATCPSLTQIIPKKPLS